ncbi:MAG: ABC transporter substrate-binding protein [Solirubrobacteraceae bacterium]
MNRRHTLAAALLLTALLALLVGCGSNTNSSGGTVGGGSTTLRVGFLADMSVPDPDVFYDIEGNSLILGTYQGLLKYAPDSTTIVGDLAKSFGASTDGLTYTFHLQPGVKFHDGTAFTSASVKASFDRRVKVNQAPAYMLAQVKQVQTPDPLTVIVKLKVRVAPFLHYLASSWGPKMIGPKAIVANAGKDFGQSYLRTHDDGTGPYVLAAFNRGSQYELDAFPGFSGTKPFFQKVLIKIVPSIGTQQLELKNGSLDAILHSYPASSLSSIAGNLQLREDKAFLRAMLYVNTNKPPFSDPAARAALAKTIDVQKIVSEAYGGTGTVPTGPYPPGILPNQPPLDYGHGPATPQKGKGGAITLAYTADESGVQQRVSEILQSELAAAGYQVTLKEVQLPQVYDFVKNLGAAPDLLLGTNTPDAAHPDPWARIVWGSAGGLNFLGFKDKQIDKLLDQAQSAPSAKANALYGQIGQRLVASHELLFLADVKDTIVEQKKLSGGAHVPAYPWMLDFASLRRA